MGNRAGQAEAMGVMASGVAYEVAATGPPPVLEAIAGLGRTEDLRFSPDGTRLAIACFRAGAIAVVDVEVSDGAGAPTVACTAVTRLAAGGLEEPHGVDWLDDRTLIVADRAGWIGLLEVPASRPGEAVDLSVELVEFDGAFADVYGPGSVRVLGREAGAADVLICNNWGNCVTRTRLVHGDRWTVSESGIGLQDQLDLPDGVATSHDGSWVAISNHNRQVVVVYDARGGAGDALDRPPVGVLRGTSYPHGLRFDGSDRLLVADAGAPLVNTYRSDDHGWSVGEFPCSAIQVLTPEEFTSGNDRPDEGGPKGVELDPSERVMVITCEAAPLRWFDWRAAQAAAPPTPADVAPLEIAGLQRETELKAALADVEYRLMAAETREHEAQARASRETERADDIERRAHELSEWAHGEIEASKRVAEEAQRAADAARRDLAAIHATKAWRILQPLRGAYARVRGRGA